MNNQQPNFQQPNFQQPNYQQPGYQQPYYPPKAPKDISGLLNKALTVSLFVFLGLAALSLFVGFIMTIVCAASDKSTFNTVLYVGYGDKGISGFSEFLNGMTWTIGTTAKYLFYSAVVIIAQKVLKK